MDPVLNQHSVNLYRVSRPWGIDDYAQLKATTVLAMLKGLGVKPSYSRPRVLA